MKHITRSGGFAGLVLAVSAGCAQAEECANTSWTGIASTDCRGAFLGDISGASGELAYLAAQWGGQWQFVGRSDDVGFGPFTGNPQVDFNGLVGLDAPRTGAFVIGLKAGFNHGYYLFDAASPVSALTFFSTEGVATSPQGNPLLSEYMTLYQLAPVPEPTSVALLALGLAGLLAARRRPAA